MGGRDGRPVIKVLVKVTDLNDAFGWTAREEHVRRIRATARPLTTEQRIAIRQVFLDHLLERQAKIRRDKQPEKRSNRD